MNAVLHTMLTDGWGLRYPIIGAPMAGAAGGALAAAVTNAGGLGIIGIGSTASTDFIAEQAAIARPAGPFGIGLMIWALAERPDLLDAALAQKPFLLSLSFGDASPYVDRCHALGIRVATQVHSRQEAKAAESAGVDLIVAQGTDAGGHTGAVGTLPLLQIVLQTVSLPVAAAGGIASAHGVAGVLAAGAAGAWIGTALLASTDTRHSPAARARILAASESDTIHTHVFDQVQGLKWPDAFPGRALRNSFSDAWHGRESELSPDTPAAKTFTKERGNVDVDVIYAGQAVGLVSETRKAADVVTALGDGAETWLQSRMAALLERPR